MTARPEELALLFEEARTHYAWLPRAVPDALLRRVYELARMAPTGGNAQPMRVVYIRTPDGKERLRPTLHEQNVEKAMTAPVTAILASDARFYDKLPQLFPARPEIAERMKAMPEEIRTRMNLQNTSMQAGYFILAARALGLDCGPMGGFDAAAVDRTFLEGSDWKSVLLVNLGHGDPEKIFPRNPRLSVEEAVRFV